jgi:(2R)-sulfolactate sulfo-lyase subunit beta
LTGAEHIVAAKAADERVREEFFAAFNDYTKLVFDQKKNDLSESQPTKGNIAGGLTTIEEKALGNVEKLGKRTKFVGCLRPAVAPAGRGLWFMDTSSAAAEAVTLWAASGAVIHLFPTGQGNVIGNPVEPVIKLSGNPKTIATMKEHIDLDVSKILQGEMTIDEAGDELLAMITRTANGRLTAAEALGHREFSMTKLYRSA